MTIDAQELTRGLIYSHQRANANTAAVHEAHTTVQAVVELLEERGLLSHDALEARKQSAAEPLRQQYLEHGMAVALQESDTSKYEFAGETKIDCENRLHLCKASCCRLGFALSSEDVQENIVRWDLGRPYTIAQDKTGYCTHCDSETRGCSVYENRPIICRGYDCSKDKRIWSDFDKRIVNPQLHDPDWPGCIQSDRQTEAPARSEDKAADAAQRAKEEREKSPATNGNAGGFRRARLPILRVERSAALGVTGSVSNPASTNNGSRSTTANSSDASWLRRLLRRWQGTSRLDALQPSHLEELNRFLHGVERKNEGTEDGPEIFTTSRGIRIAASQFMDGDDQVAHFSISRKGRALDETSAVMLGQYIARNISASGEPELIAAEEGVFHLLIHPIANNVPDGRRNTNG